ncbi:MAG TPA: DUF5110 domain-containing protein, partial [Ktedonobacteraceae bacterium]|nr:DUF5110 domain-containing protein [Ktedonobacteraceae bacterium]
PDPLTFVLYPCEGSGIATFYEDAGDGFEYSNDVYARRTITCAVEAGHIRIVIGEQEGTFVSTRQDIRLELREVASEPEAVQIGETSATWHYHSEQRRLTIDLDTIAFSQLVELSIE